MSKSGISKRRILVVDDEPTVCDAVKLMLTFDGHDVEAVASGSEALVRLERGPFDLVITDYAMPQMRGDELARRILQQYPALPVVMITAHAEALQSTGTPLPGVAMILTKPFMLETLRDAVRKICPDAAEPNPGKGG